jgi:outer membrane protein assembly factor BamB
VGSDDNNTYALNAMTGTQVWNYTTGNSVYSSPAVANGTVYVGSEDDKLYCLDAYTGASVWNYTTGGWVDSSPAVANGIVYVGSDDWNVYAFSTPTDWWTMFHHDLNRTGYSTSTAPTTNQTLWNYATFGSVFSSPAVANGTVYVGSEDDNVTALNAATGAYIWSYNTTSPVESSPAVANGIVYVGSDGDNVTALNAATGAYIWSYTTGAPVESSPAVANGMVYVGSNDTHVYALNAATGTQVWNYTTGGPVESSPAVSGGIVYVGSDDDNVTALDETTGAYIWSYNTTSPIGYSSPAVANGTVYVCSTSGGVFALNASALPMSPTTRCIWNVYHGASPWLDSPAVFGGVVYASGDGYTYALNATNSGSLIWLYKTGDSAGTGPTGGPGPISSCAVADGVVYIGGYVTTVVKGSPTNLGEIYALNATVPPGQTIPYTPVCLWNYTTGPPQVNSSPAVANGTVYVGSDDNNTYAFGAHLISITGPWPIPPPILKTVVGLGYSVGMAVTAADLGSYTETFNVALFANTTILASQNVMLPSGASTTLAFTWNTTGFAYGNYTLSAYASPVPGQTNTTNNSLTVGNVFVTIPGDVNGDGTVNILDAILLANAFTATPGSSNWNPNADINCDGVVNILDAIILANNFTASIP